MTLYDLKKLKEAKRMAQQKLHEMRTLPKNAYDPSINRRTHCDLLDHPHNLEQTDNKENTK